MSPTCHKRDSVFEKTPILDYPGRGRAVLEPVGPGTRARRLPRRCVLCFFGEVIERERRRQKLQLACRLPGEGDPLKVYVRGSGSKAVTLAWPGMTAPFAAAVLEELSALGCRDFIACGGAGVLDGSIPPGRVIIPTQALRDEGTSYHYLEPARYVRPHPEALEAVRLACREAGVEFIEGKTWTTDGLYRETAGQVRSRRREGCLAVEMEAAAFFAVARFRKLRLAQILYAGDDVSGRKWKSRAWRRRRDTREQLYQLALDAVSRLV